VAGRSVISYQISKQRGQLNILILNVISS